MLLPSFVDENLSGNPMLTPPSVLSFEMPEVRAGALCGRDQVELDLPVAVLLAAVALADETLLLIPVDGVDEPISDDLPGPFEPGRHHLDLLDDVHSVPLLWD
jgi:hypothetical protein